MARDDSGEFEVLKDEPKGPKPKVTVLTMILIFLNLTAAVAFLVLMVMTMQRRQQGAAQTFEPDFIIQGLPLAEEEDGLSGSRAALPRQKLSGDELKAIFRWRLGESLMRRAPEPFKDADEPYKHTVLPSQLTKEILDRHFHKKADGAFPFGEPVTTLEEEIQLQKDAFPKLLAEVAGKYVSGSKGLDEDKLRDKVRRVVLPAASSPGQIDQMLVKIDGATPSELLKILEEGVQRRILLDVLLPMEVYRPATLETKEAKFLLPFAGDVGTYPLDRLLKLFQERMEGTIADKYAGELYAGSPLEGKPRGSIEKRHAVGMALLALAYARGPDEKLLDATAEERAYTVLGLWEFTYSAANYTFCLGLLHMAVLDDFERDEKGEVVKDGSGLPISKAVPLGFLVDVHADREGHDFTEFKIKNWDDVKKDPKVTADLEKLPEKKLIPTLSFLARYQDMVQELKVLKREVHVTEERLKALEKQNELATTNLKERAKHLVETIERLNAARILSAEMAAKSRELQEQLFLAQLRLVEAAEQIYLLEAEIRARHLPPTKGKSK